MAEVIRFPGITRLDLSPDAVLEEAMGCLEGVVVIGYTKDGDEYFSASYADGGEIVWLLERFKHQLMKMGE